MNLTKLRLINFKLFRDVEIQFRPLTLLTGANSSGKSTVLNALSAVLQAPNAASFPFEFIPNGSNCALGGFRDIVHGHNTRNLFSIGLSLSRGKEVSEIDARYRYSSSGDHILPDNIRYSSGDSNLEATWRGKESGYQYKFAAPSFIRDQLDERMTALMGALHEVVENRPEVEKSRTKKPQDKEQLIKDYRKRIEEEAAIGNTGQTAKPHRASSLRDLLRKHLVGQVLTQQILDLNRSLRDNFSYVGPVRAYPARHYASEETGVGLDPAGEQCVRTLVRWRRHYPVRYREVIRLLNDLTLASDVYAKATRDEILKLDVRPFRHSEKANLADVGFGISQVLPILVTDVALPKDGTLAVNQPEVHLHPSSQAELGNYFARRIKSRRYIVETHSEYLLNRIRLLVAQKKLKSDDVSLIYFSTSANSGLPRAHQIEIQQDGSLANAPRSFFSTYSTDTFRIAMSGFKS